jgi:hypothetical protein
VVISNSLIQLFFCFLTNDREAAIISLRKDISSTRVEIAEIEAVIQKMSPSVQTRVDKSVVLSLSTTSTPDEDVQDVLVPDLYREFQQDR